MAKVIGLLGGSGAGKSTAAEFLEQNGCVVIDADKVSRKVSRKGEDGYEAAVLAFGPQILDETGEIDRRALAGRVFSDPRELEKLEAALHPVMAREIERMIEESEAKTAVLDCAVLLKPAFRRMPDEIWYIAAPSEKRAERIMRRDRLSEEEALTRISAQLSETEMEREADRIIINEGSIEELHAKIAEALENT